MEAEGAWKDNEKSCCKGHSLNECELYPAGTRGAIERFPARLGRRETVLQADEPGMEGWFEWGRETIWEVAAAVLARGNEHPN